MQMQPPPVMEPAGLAAWEAGLALRFHIDDDELYTVEQLFDLQEAVRRAVAEFVNDGADTWDDDIEVRFYLEPGSKIFGIEISWPTTKKWIWKMVRVAQVYNAISLGAERLPDDIDKFKVVVHDIVVERTAGRVRDVQQYPFNEEQWKHLVLRFDREQSGTPPTAGSAPRPTPRGPGPEAQQTPLTAEELAALFPFGKKPRKQ